MSIYGDGGFTPPRPNSVISDGTNGLQARVLNSAPGSDTGQSALAVRVISQLGAGGSGGTTDVTDRVGRLLGHVTVDNASLAVTGTFWQATQPVSGTFWQAVQPTRLQDGVGATLATVTAANALKVDGSAVTQPVSGTFWQATQPVSGTVTANQGTANTNANLPGSPVLSFTAAASAQGTSEIQTIQSTTPIKSTAVNTATTIVCPATTGVIWRVNVWYYAAV